MTAKEATAEVFWTAFQALPRDTRQAVMERLVADQQFREDLMDIAVMEQRGEEPSRSLDDYLADRDKQH